MTHKYDLHRPDATLRVVQPSPYQQSQGWFPDPYGRYEYRWFNGTSWTADVSSRGERFVDPYGVVATVPSRSRNGVATASLVLGVIAVLIAWLPVIFAIGIVLAIIAIALGVSARGRAKANGETSGAATAGIVTGAIALVTSLFGIWLTVITVRELTSFVNPGDNAAEVTDCTFDARSTTVEATLTNLSTTERDYTVFAASVGNDPDAAFVESVNDVEPNETRSFSMVYVGSVDRPCPVQLIVLGPLPFGINVGPTVGTGDD